MTADACKADVWPEMLILTSITSLTHLWPEICLSSMLSASLPMPFRMALTWRHVFTRTEPVVTAMLLMVDLLASRTESVALVARIWPTLEEPNGFQGQQGFRSDTSVRIARALKTSPFRLFMTGKEWAKWKRAR